MSLYWMLVLGNISFVCGLFAIMLAVAIIVALIVALIVVDDIEYAKSKFIGMSIAFAVLLLGSIFIPSTESLMKIYVVDNVVEYIETNDKARELPDKVIECCDKLMNEYLEEDKDE